MSTALLFLFGAIVVVAFILAKIADLSSEAQKTREDLAHSFDPKKEWDIGALLLKIGPVFAGFGLLGYLANNWWGDINLRLILILIMTFVAYGGGAGFYYFGKNSPSSKVFGEALTLIGAFLTGAVLYTTNEVAYLSTGSNLFGLSEILGIWFLLLLPIAYFTRSTWVMAIGLLINMVWLATYLNVAFNFSGLFNFNTNDISTSSLFYLGLPTLSAIILTVLHAWHQTRNDNNTDSGWRAFFYLTGLMAYLTVGSLVFRGIAENFDQFQSIENGLIADVILSILTLGVFLIDFIAKKTLKNYNINYLTPIIVFTAAVIGPLFFPGKLFIGFYFLEVTYIVWLLADFLRQKSQVAQVLFYTFNAIQLFAISTNNDNYNWFKLIVILGIIMYASIVNFRNRTLVFYVIIAGILSLVFKVFATGASGYIVITLIGLIMMAFGFYYTQTRAKMINEMKNTEKPLE